MSWLWLNISLGAVFFLATAGIPMWLVLRHPDERRPARTSALDATPQSRPALVMVPAAGTVGATSPQMRVLAGASSRAGRA